MKTFKTGLCVFFSFILLCQIAYSSEKKDLVRFSLKDYATEMKWIQLQGLDVAGINFQKHEVDLIVNAKEMQLLKARGLKIALNLTEAVRAAPDPLYKTPDKIEALLNKFATDYPNLTTLSTIGKSLEGRNIWALKIKKNSDKAAKPTILFNGTHHAREIMTPEVVLDIAETLLTQYGKDSKITHWVDANEIWLVPMLNVDGNNKVWTQDNWWRKNTREGYGVDINRNYPYNWNTCSGSSGSTFSQTYRGTSAGSEPETQVLMSLVKNIHPVFDISFHSYSELVIYPYGCPGQHTATKEVVEGIGQELANLLPSDDGQGHYTAGTAPELLYAVDGGDIDWMYHEGQVIPYVIELNSSNQGFQPSYSTWRDKTILKLRAAWGHLLDKLDGASIRGQVLSVQGQTITGSTVSVERQNTPQTPFQQIYLVQADGSFHLILNPGIYTVSFQAPGYQSKKQDVKIENVRVNINIQLSRD